MIFFNCMKRVGTILSGTLIVSPVFRRSIELLSVIIMRSCGNRLTTDELCRELTGLSSFRGQNGKMSWCCSLLTAAGSTKLAQTQADFSEESPSCWDVYPHANSPITSQHLLSHLDRRAVSRTSMSGGLFRRTQR